MAYNSTRELVLARRKAMSEGGKASLPNTGNAAPSAQVRSSVATSAPAAAPAASVSSGLSASYSAPATSSVSVARKASLARREAMSTSGKRGIQSKDRTRAEEGSKATAQAPAPASTPTATTTEKKGCGCGCGGTRKECQTKIADSLSAAPVATGNATASIQQAKNAIHRSVARAASLARREAMSTRGKGGVSKNGVSAAQTARAGKPALSSRDLSKAIREQRSTNGAAGQKKSAPCGRVRPKVDAETGAAQDAPWKVGASETTRGQTVTGTMVGRADNMTGDEPSTCRGITGTEYLGADIFRDFCDADPKGTPGKVTVTSTSHGNSVTGNRIGRGSNVTGNEQGTCKSVTGDEYISAEQSQAYCGEFASKSPRKGSMAETMKGKVVTGDKVGRSEKVTGDEPGMNRALTGTQYTAPQEIGGAPAKVGMSGTLRGGAVTGTMVGRRENMTGDEAGSCRNVTGDDYVGEEQFSGFCSSTPEPQDQKVGVTATGKGMTVTGTMTDRVAKVTGNEPGTCKAVTGTPYAGMDQSGNFCQAEDAAMADMRTRRLSSTPGMTMTGQQPGIGGVMTGADKGACENVSGTPYVGADQFADACPATPADSNSPDYPQAIGTNAPWDKFSVTPPSGGAAHADGSTGVTGNQYEKGGITGPFGMAPGKVTGTEEARFGNKNVQQPEMRPVVAEDFEGRTKSRITGEGQDSGLKITGDDWERGNVTTGTEGASAIRRNPTMRMGPNDAMAVVQKRNEELPVPNSKVTGGSGNTDKGSLITYSGGARG
ncbi:MAG: CsoS2 family carboxysome shell protein [bacterium]